MFQNKSFVSAATFEGSNLPESLLNNKDFWRELFAALADDAMISFHLNQDGSSAVSLLKMSGFSQVEVTP